MPLETLLLFVPACFALNMAFGPNNLLSITLGARHGLRTPLLAATGRLVAFTLMIAIAALGMGAVLTASELAFTVVKIAGAAYLVWLGIKILRAPATVAVDQPEPAGRGLASFMRQEFLVAIGNPKAILIFTAFFPQFVVAGHYWSSFALLGAIFLALELVAIALYAYAGTRLSGVMRHARGLRWINRISGATMIAFGGLLMAARRPAM
ncbi:lysine transporter LysE [Rhizobium rhizosphaerae]|uniref:Lysine transporter LysE n=1 Tax=Xaviernesmea rhizosphaerae TaxID=1672749 RepID=A0A1Q9AK29_9HYPH|nr:LysE family translocator [Xaviernesmea rhizosphaerae]OLP55629.1 lysine transporter LysE [Xaviernesmea rhizosphaerae]OQP86626.1 lysine transporter LysE [Xaviernesmea rhizosphaerae]